MRSITTELAHAIIFVLDPNNHSAVVPEYKASELVAATDSCISVAAIPSVDGAATITLSRAIASSADDRRSRHHLKSIGFARLNTPSGNIAVVSADVGLLEDVTETNAVYVRIFANREHSPSEIRIEFGGPKEVSESNLA